MKRTQIQIDEETHAALRRAAYEQGRSFSSLVRETLSEAYGSGRKTSSRQRKQLPFAGAGRSQRGKPAPVSERHDEALDEALAAAQELASRSGCSVSEAIRRSVVRQRDAELGVSAGRRRERAAALERLFELFEENDPGTEIRRLKAEDEGF